MKIHILTVIILISFFLGCSSKTNATNEMVMSEGFIVEATNKNGTIKIIAGKTFERTYLWGHKQIELTLRPRKERWYGSLGAYSSGGDRNIHAVTQEGQQHFCSETEALEWLSGQHDLKQYVYTPDGLVVGWYESKDPNSSQIALSVSLWQFYLNGKKPVSLKGANRKAIKTYSRNGSAIELPIAGEFIPSNPKVINGRLYSGRAIDYMNDIAINVTAEEIEKTIATGEMRQDGIYRDYYQFNADNFMWVTLDKEGRVVLIGK